MSTPNTKEITPYHLLEIKVAEIQEQLENIASVSSNKHLFEKTRTQYEEKPIGEMQLVSRVGIVLLTMIFPTQYFRFSLQK
jgi:hypothetical protein